MMLIMTAEAGWLEALPLLTAPQRRELRSVFRRALVESPLPTVLTDTDGVILGVNEQFCELLTAEEINLHGRSLFQLLHEDDRDQARDEFLRVAAGHPRVTKGEGRLIRADDRVVWARGHLTLVDGPTGDSAAYVVGIMQDLTKVRFAQRQAATLIDIGTSVAAGAPIEDAATKIAELASHRWSQVGCTLTIVDPARHVVVPVRHRLMPPGLYDAFGDIPIGPESVTCGLAAWSDTPAAMPDMSTDPRTAQFRELLDRFGIVSSWSVPLHDADGRVVGTLGLYHPQPHEPDEDDWRILHSVAGVAAIAIQVEQRRRRRDRERRRLRVDARTGLANEVALLEHADALLGAREQVTIAVATVRGPAHIRNDRTARDRVLVDLASRVRAIAGVAEVGVSGVASLTVIGHSAWTDEQLALLHRTLSSSVEVEQLTVQPEIAIGMATTGDDEVSAADLLVQAKSAVPTRPGTATFTAFWEKNAADYALAADVAKAFRNDEFVVYYQPQFDLVTGELVGSEALVRWQHPDRGLLAPGQFLPAIEAIGASAELAFTVTRIVAAEAEHRTRVGLTGKVAVNFNATDLHNDSVLQMLRDPERQLWRLMTIELTESQFAEPQTVATLEDLAALGYSVALDDFGTGYSALASIHALPLSIVKIDRSFVDRVPADPSADALIAAMTALCNQLAITVVAEGVETHAQVTTLRNVGCGRAQGFLFSKPLPLSEHTQATLHPQLAPVPPRTRRDRPGVTKLARERIRQLDSQGASPHTIAAALNREGHRTSAGTRWHARTVMAVLGGASDQL